VTRLYYNLLRKWQNKHVFFSWNPVQGEMLVEIDLLVKAEQFFKNVSQSKSKLMKSLTFPYLLLTFSLQLIASK